MRFSRSSAAALAASIPIAVAQTSTSCDPTKKTCPEDTALNSGSYTADFTSGSSAAASWSSAIGTTITYGSQGAEFTIDKAGQAPTVQTDFYIFFGRISIKMKAAPGTGIVSSMVLESDDLDEIDWEFLGGNTAQVETNFFGKGNTTTYDRAIYYSVSTPQESFHTYTIDWNSDRIEWIVDGVTVRTLAATDSSTNGGNNYPQTPMRLKLGNWCGGCSGEPDGTIEWAGGNTTFNDAPYVMYVESVTIENTNPADAYEYTDKTGSWESIKLITSGNSSSSAGGASSGAASSSAASSTVSAKGTATASLGSSSVTGTVAPTSSVSVAAVDQQTAAAVSKTVAGASYSMNTASASAQNASNGTMATSVVGTATGAGVAGSTGTGSASSTGSSGGSNSNGTYGGASSSGVATQSTSGASANTIMTLGSLLSVALGFLML